MPGACALDPAQKHTGLLDGRPVLGLHWQVTGEGSWEEADKRDWFVLERGGLKVFTLLLCYGFCWCFVAV